MVLAFRILVAFAATLPLAGFAIQSCDLTPEQTASFMQQDYDTFDQKPQGWRSLYTEGGACNLTIALLIDSYHLGHQGQLVPWQDRILYWHAGQAFGFINLYDLAILRFRNTFDPEEATPPEFHWNAYARATIAFLQKDRAALQKALDEFVNTAPAEVNNFKLVERFVRCFEASYFDAYTGTGTCTP